MCPTSSAAAFVHQVCVLGSLALRGLLLQVYPALPDDKAAILQVHLFASDDSSADGVCYCIWHLPLHKGKLWMQPVLWPWLPPSPDLEDITGEHPPFLGNHSLFFWGDAAVDLDSYRPPQILRKWLISLLKPENQQGPCVRLLCWYIQAFIFQAALINPPLSAVTWGCNQGSCPGSWLASLWPTLSYLPKKKQNISTGLKLIQALCSILLKTDVVIHLQVIHDGADSGLLNTTLSQGATFLLI